MKWKSFFPSIFLVSILFACSKKESTPPDPRDAFVGNYKGTLNLRITSLNANQTSQITSYPISKVTSSTNQITVNGDRTATVNGNSYTLSQFSGAVNTTAGTVVAFFNGTGTLNGSNLTESGTFTMVVQGNNINGTWSTNLVKQ